MKYKDTVAAIAARMRQFYDAKQPYRIYHGSTNSTRAKSLSPNATLDTSSLNHVQRIDTATKTAFVEPNVPMDELVRATLPHGLIPPVVMEFPGITVGGGFAGTGGESSSFKHGFFDRTVKSVEMVLANGEIVKASESERSDLFAALPGSLGTLGVTTLLELRLVEARKYVQVTYHAVDGIASARKKMKALAKDVDVEYLDGIMYSPTEGVIVSGKLSDSPSPGSTVQGFTDAWDPWFYMHAQEVSRKSEEYVETVPIVDYLFRYDRGAFWMGAYAYKYFWWPFNQFSRWFMDYFMHTRVMYQALHESGHSEQIIIQDLVLPEDNTEEFVKYVDEQLGIYPLWLCPFKGTDKSQPSMNPNPKFDGDYMNVGVWGLGPADKNEFEKANRELEKKVHELGGRKWQYAHAYYTEEEFWKIYDKPWYDSLRVKYDAASLPNVYEKSTSNLRSVKTHPWWFKIWPLSGFYGGYKTMTATEYLMKPLASQLQGK